MTAFNPNAGILSPDNLAALRSQGMKDDAIADQMAQVSPHFASQVSKIRKKFGGDPAATTAFLNTRFYGDTAYSPGSTANKGFIGRTLDRVYKDYQDIQGAQDRSAERIDKAGGGLLGGLRTFNAKTDEFLQTAGNVGSMMMAPVTQATTDVVGGAASALGVDKLIEGGVRDVVNSDIYKEFQPGVSRAINTVQQADPDALQSIGAIGEFGVDALDVYGAGKALELGAKGVMGTAKAVRHPIQTVKGLAKGAPAASATVTPEGPMALAGKAKEAVDKGVDERVVRFILERSDDEKHLMKAMTTEAERGTRLLGGTTKHKEIVGQQILRNAEHIIDTRQNVGKSLGAMTQAMKNEAVDFTETSRQVFKEMSSKGVLFDRTGKTIVSAAGFADDEVAVLQRIADFFQPDSAGRVVKKFGDGDLFRKKLFAELNMAKAKLAPTSGGQTAFSASDRLADTVRSLLLKDMGAKNKNYQVLAQTYAELMAEPADFFKLIGYKGPLDEIGKDALGTGEKAMRVLGNASARPTEALQKLFNIAKKYGYESNVDEMALIRYADELENVFPMAPTRSLRGEVGRAGDDIVKNVIQKKGAIRGGVSYLDEKLLDAYKWARGLTPENRMRLLNELLDAKPGESLVAAAKDVIPASQIPDTLEGVKAKEAIKIIDDVPKAPPGSRPGFVKIPGKKPSASSQPPKGVMADSKAAGIPKELEPLAREARKAKSADEFLTRVQKGPSTEEQAAAFKKMFPFNTMEEAQNAVREFWYMANGKAPPPTPVRKPPTPIPGTSLNVEDIPF